MSEKKISNKGLVAFIRDSVCKGVTDFEEVFAACSVNWPGITRVNVRAVLWDEKRRAGLEGRNSPSLRAIVDKLMDEKEFPTATDLLFEIKERGLVVKNLNTLQNYFDQYLRRRV